PAPGRPEASAGARRISVSFLFNLSTPREDARFPAGSLGLLDVAVAHVKKRQAGPRELVIWLQLHAAQAGLDGLLVPAGLHQRHPERVPAFEVVRVNLHTTPVLLR